MKDGHAVCLLLPLWCVFSLQAENFRVSALKWSLSPSVQLCVLAQQKVHWEVAGRLEGSSITFHRTSPVLAVSSLSHVLLHQVQGTKEPRRCCCSAVNAELPQEVGTEKLVSAVAVSHEAQGDFSMPVTSGQNTTVAEAGRKEKMIYIDSDINHSLSHSQEHCESPFLIFQSEWI